MERGVIACKIDKPTKKGWYPIAMTGTWKGHSAGEFSLDQRALEQIRINFDAAGLDVVVDYEHQSLYGMEAPAAGWIKHPGGLRVANDTLLAQIEWTPKAKERIKSGEYRYLSPTLVNNALDTKSGKNVGWALHSVALTNTPFFNELPPVAANRRALPTYPNTKENTMSKEELDKLKKENETLKKRLKEQKKEILKQRKLAASKKVEEAIAAKKLSPKQKEWGIKYALNDPSGFDDFLANARPIISKPQDDQFLAASASEPANISMDKI